MKNIKTNTILLFACVAVFAANAGAFINNDSAAMADYAGRTSIDVVQSGIELNVNVEYAVYAPGAYPGSDISGGSKYIYAYQVFNNVKSNVTVDFFSVGIVNPVTVSNTYIDNTYGYEPTNAVSPAISNIFAQSVGFIFSDQNFNPRKWSNVLIFTSQDGPAMGFGAVSGGGLCGNCDLPSPSVTSIPEPVTIILFTPAFFILKDYGREIARIK